jgi:hypothetical protein
LYNKLKFPVPPPPKMSLSAPPPGFALENARAGLGWEW